jgi:calcineurin-like phosphoesterase family protein
MSTVYFISDTHFGHRNICKYRTEFNSAEEHDEFVFDNIMSTGSKRDTLWMLGDLFFTEESIKKFDEINNKFNCVNVIFGNHCTEGKGKIISKYIANNCNRFGSMFKYKGFWLTHAPIHANELRGKYNIHGHTHHHIIDDHRYINVSVENINYKPISYNEIMERVK